MDSIEGLEGHLTDACSGYWIQLQNKGRARLTMERYIWGHKVLEIWKL